MMNMNIIWGLKTISIFDIWSFEHLISGISIGAIAIKCNNKILKKHFHIDPGKRKTSYFDLIAVLFLAYIWETVEHYLEIGTAGNTIKYWFQGVEYWPNRVLSDPLMTLIGYYIARSISYLVNPARIISVLWLVLHIFVFPHSMYLHEIL